MNAKIDKMFDAATGRSLEDQLAFLADLTQSFAASLEVRKTLRMAGEKFIEYLDAEASSIFLLHPGDGESRGTLECHGCAGPVDITGMRLPADKGIVGKTVQTCEPQMVRDTKLDPSFSNTVDEETGFETKSILCAPLIVRGECIGALELINKKSADGMFDEHDRNLTTALASAAALAIRTAQMADELVEKERIRKELELAREIQLDFLPRPQQRDTQSTQVVHGINVPAREVSGDFYDYFTLPDGRVYFNLADVSGKGMNAALVMAKACSLLHHLAKSEESPGQLLSRVNDEIAEHTTSRGMFITIISGFIDPTTNEIRLANAGHPPALYHHADGTFEQVPPSAPPIGIMPELAFPETSVKMDGSLYLFTDGASEALDVEDPYAAVERLIEVIKDKAHLPSDDRLRNIVSTIGALAGEQKDDITLLLIEAGGEASVVVE